MTIETGPPDESYEKNIEFLIDSLPEYMENDTTSGNWKLFSPVGDQFNNLENDIQSVNLANDLETADTIEQLETQAKLVDLSLNPNESKKHFRSRISAYYKLNTAEGTISDVFNLFADVLNIKLNELRYTKMEAPGTDQIIVPKDSVLNSNLTLSEIEDITNNLTPAGHELKIIFNGTLNYITPTTYQNTTDWSSYDGYDGLTVNELPKQNGGTYAGPVGYEAIKQTISVLQGTFDYVTPTTYQNKTDWSSSSGYDGLDADGQRKGNGGRYSEVAN